METTITTGWKSAIKLNMSKDHNKQIALVASTHEQAAPYLTQPVQSKWTLIPPSWRRKSGRTTTVIESFYHAFNGVWTGLKEQRNVRIHLILASAVILAGLVLGVDRLSWIALSFAIGFVLTAEFVNTSIEHLVDMASGGTYHPAARAAKDTAAAAVLIASIVAFVTGLLVLGPKLLALVS